jgi:preprotein translocase subunit SecY
VFSAFTNSLKIPELRSRIFYTLALLFVARVGAHIPLPGIDPLPLQHFFADQTQRAGGALVGLYNMFTGGALVKGAVCALGIMPYISASIIFQLMTAVVPMLSRLQQEGDVGRQKLTQYTRYATVADLPGAGHAVDSRAGKSRPASFSGFDVGTYGQHRDGGQDVVPRDVDHLHDRRHHAAHVARRADHAARHRQRRVAAHHRRHSRRHPGRGTATYQLFFRPVGTGAGLGLPQAVVMVALFVAVTMGIIMVVQGQRKIPVQYAKRVVGNKVMGGQSSFLPLKVNYSGVMPVIFASAILLFPQQIFSQIGAAFNIKFLIEFSAEPAARPLVLLPHLHVPDPVLQLFLGVGHVQADPDRRRPQEIRRLHPRRPPGRADRAVPRFHHDAPHPRRRDLPHRHRGHARRAALRSSTSRSASPYFFGGTGMLITVGVILDTMRQIETFLLQRHYDGFLKKGRIRARSANPQGGMTGDALSHEAVMKIALPMLGLLLLGLVIWFYKASFK